MSITVANELRKLQSRLFVQAIRATIRAKELEMADREACHMANNAQNELLARKLNQLCDAFLYDAARLRSRAKELHEVADTLKAMAGVAEMKTLTDNPEVRAMLGRTVGEEG